jgi:cytochrome P450
VTAALAGMTRCSQLLVAKHDATTSLIGNATAALLRHLAERDALVADPGLASRCSDL